MNVIEIFRRGRSIVKKTKEELYKEIYNRDYSELSDAEKKKFDSNYKFYGNKLKDRITLPNQTSNNVINEEVQKVLSKTETTLKNADNVQKAHTYKLKFLTTNPKDLKDEDYIGLIRETKVLGDDENANKFYKYLSDTPNLWQALNEAGYLTEGVIKTKNSDGTWSEGETYNNISQAIKEAYRDKSFDETTIQQRPFVKHDKPSSTKPSQNKKSNQTKQKQKKKGGLVK